VLDTVGVYDVLVRAGAFGAQRSFVDWRFWIPLDVYDPFVLDVDQLAAADGAIGTD